MLNSMRWPPLRTGDTLGERAGGDEDVALALVAGHETEALLGVEELTLPVGTVHLFVASRRHPDGHHRQGYPLGGTERSRVADAVPPAREPCGCRADGRRSRRRGGRAVVIRSASGERSSRREVPARMRRRDRNRVERVRASWHRGAMPETTESRAGPAPAQAPEAGRRLTLRGIWGALPTPGRWLLSTTAVSTLGRGMTLPFTVIYVHEVRGIPLDVAGLLMGLIAVIALLVTIPVGCAHRPPRGARRRRLRQPRPAGRRRRAGLRDHRAGLLVAIDAPRHELRRRVAGFNAMIANIVTAGCARSTSASTSPWSTSASASAASSAGSSPTSTAPHVHRDLPRRRGLHARANRAAPRAPASRRRASSASGSSGAGSGDGVVGSGYLAILRTPPSAGSPADLPVELRRLRADGGRLPGLRARGQRGVDRTIGLAFAANTTVIVGCQFFVLRRIDGHRRTRVFLALVGLWARHGWCSARRARGRHPAAAVGVVVFHVSSASARPMLQPTVPRSSTTSPASATEVGSTPCPPGPSRSGHRRARRGRLDARAPARRCVHRAAARLPRPGRPAGPRARASDQP